MQDRIKLEGRDLSLSFGGIHALVDVSFKIPEGEIVGLVGPNGSGKTCILNIINGFYKPRKGEVLLDGRNILGIPPHKVAKLGVGRSFQQMELFRGASVLENLLVGCHPSIKGNIFSAGIYWGFSQKTELQLRQLAEEVLDFMELEGYRKQVAADLSIGTQKLIGIARALCSQPKILLLDEPSSGLSHDEKEDLARFLLRIKYEKGISILWIEHDMTLVGELADRLIVLDHGRKITEGNPEEVFNHPEVMSIYSGTKSKKD